ncbi:MAG: hypothetical protein ACOX5A_11890 [Aminivibrio sp.]|jgi:hypothetical protein
MKQIIDGKRYDTETATLIGSHERGYPGDLHHIFEGLYLTGKGNFFLHGKGGAASRYGESCGNESWGSSRITPMSREEAFEWAQTHLSPDEYEGVFADAIEDA